MEDLTYLLQRQQAELLSAEQAICESARQSHLQMARAYGVRIEACRAKSGRMSAADGSGRLRPEHAA